MKSFAVALLSLLASAAAFAPVNQQAASTKVQAVFDDMEGAVDFRGAEFKFDPVSDYGIHIDLLFVSFYLVVG